MALLTYTNRSTAPHSPHSPLCLRSQRSAESTGRRGARGRQRHREEGREERGGEGGRAARKKTPPFTHKHKPRGARVKVPAHLHLANHSAPGDFRNSSSLCVQNKSILCFLSVLVLESTCHPRTFATFSCVWVVSTE